MGPNNGTQPTWRFPNNVDAETPGYELLDKKILLDG